MADLEPVRCASCGAPVPLAASSPVPCAHCAQPVALPVIHVDLFARLARGRAALREADALWRSLPRPMPRGVVPAFVAGIVAVVFASIGAWAFVVVPAMGAPGRMFALVVVMPSLLALHGGLELLAYWSPLARLETRFSARADARYPGLALCRACGAALSVEADALVVRCGYCDTESLVRSLRLAAFQHVRETDTQGREGLDVAIANLRMLRDQRLIVRGMSLSMITAIVVLLTVALWNR